MNKLKKFALDAYQIWSEAETKYKMIAAVIAVLVIISIIT